MAYVEGKPLSELIPSDGLPPESVIRYGLQIADALAHAHEKSIVHRDLKSQNVVITPEGRAKVLDFGLATRLEKQDAEAVTVSMETRADVGRIAGTLAYMAPEVLRGEEATARSDTWALGVLLYEMASGVLPFGGPTKTDVVSAIVTQSPAALPPRVSAGLRAIIHRCLAKEPRQRYAGAIAVQAALEAIQSDSATHTSSAAAPSETWSWRLTAGLGALALFVVGVGYLLQFRADAPSPLVPRLTNPVQLTRAITVEDYPVWSPDGQMLAYVANQTIWVTQVTRGPGINRTGEYPGTARWPSWSPDGSALVYSSGGDDPHPGVKSVPTLGGSPRNLAANGRWPRLLAGGSDLAYLSSGGVMNVVNVLTGSARQLDLPGVGGGRSVQAVSWSPEEDRVAYWVGSTSNSGNAQLWILDTTVGEGIPVTDATWWNGSPSWSPDGRTLYFVSNRGGSRDLWQQRLTSDSRPEGEPDRLTSGIGMTRAAMSPDGTKVAYTQGGPVSNVWRVPISNDRPAAWADAEQLTFEQALIEQSSLSADGMRFALDSDRSGNFDIWIRTLATGAMQQLTTDPAMDFGPTWSPTDDEIVFVSFRSGNRDLWLMSAAGGTPRQLTTDEARDIRPAWSPDGTEIVFNSNRSGAQGVWVTDVAGSQASLLVERGSYPCWSPDGRWVAYTAPTDSGADGLWRVMRTGGTPELLLSAEGNEGFQGPIWSASGEEIYVKVLPGSGVQAPQIVALGLDDRARRNVTNFTGKLGRIVEKLDTDGEYIYFSWWEELGDIWVMDVVQDEEQ